MRPRPSGPRPWGARVATLVFLGALLASPLATAKRRTPPPPPEPPVSEEAEVAWLAFLGTEQPDLAGRQLAAEARTLAAARYGEGELALRLAFPALANAPLGSEGWLAARLAALDEAATAREQRRIGPQPPLERPEREELRTQALDAALDAEDEADRAERRVLLLIREAVRSQPALTQAAQADLEGELERLRSTAEAAWTAASEEDKPKALERIAQIEATRSFCRGLVGAALDSAVRGGPPQLAATAVSPDTQDELLLVSALLARHLFGEAGGVGVTSGLQALGLVGADGSLPLPPELLRSSATRGREASAKAAEEARRAEESAAVAQREAEEARRVARDARGRRVAAILEQSAAAQEAARLAWEEIDARERALEEERLGLEEHLAATQAERSALAGLTTLDPTRSSRAAAAWRELRDLIRGLRREALEQGWRQQEASSPPPAEDASEREAARGFAAQLTDPEAKADVDQSVSAWEAAIQRQRDAAVHWAEVADAHQEALLAALLRAKETRRSLRPYVSAQAVAADRGDVWQDVRLELQLAVPNLKAMATRRVSAARHALAPEARVGVLGRLVSGSFWVLVGLFAWWAARRRAPGLVDLVGSARARSATMYRVELERIRAPLGRVAVAAVDLVALSLLLGPTRQSLPELAVLLVLFRLVVTWRLLMGLFQLAVVNRDEGRPALFRLGPKAHGRAQRGARLLLLLGVAALWARYLATDFLGAEALGMIVAFVLRSGVVILLVVQLHRAEPLLRPAMGAALGTGRISKWAASSGRGAWITRAPRAAIGVVTLTGLRLWQITEAAAEEGTLLASLVNRVNRSRMKEGKEQRTPGELPRALALELRAAAIAADLAGEEPLVERADAALAAGQDGTDRRGLLAILGDVGQGKGRWSEQWSEHLAAQGRTVVRTTLPGRLSTRAEVRAWAAEAVGAESAASLDEHFEEMEPSVLLVQEAERTFLRRVGGSEALEELLDLASAHDDRHFWVFTFHAPAWRYLARVRRVLNPDAFQAVLELDRRTGAELRARFEAAMSACGVELDFAGLVRPGTLAEDFSSERERATDAWFRLLAEAAGGNAGVAWRMAVECLSPMHGGTTLRVRLSERLARGAEATLADNEQLVASALYVHGPLSLAELGSVHNTTAAKLAPVVRALQDRGLLDERPDDHRSELGLLHLPSIVRTLRRRHFVHGGS